MRSFVCCKAGYRREKVMDNGSACSTRRRARNKTRCGCSASFKVRLNELEGLYYPVEFRTMHNHDLVESTLSHFLPSHRQVDNASAHQISELRAAGIKLAQIMYVMVKNRGGFENVGFTRKDLYNHIYSSQSQEESSQECQLALQYLQSLARTDPGVYVRVDTDDEDRITKIFFADTISRTEYAVFGDVVFCDSTYKTNHLRLPLAMLVGVDNHCSTIVYACVLMTDETKETYKWVFESFIACMGHAPGLVITDGDRAMRWALREVMPQTKHRLCYWHIVRNLSGPCQNRNFKNDLHAIMRTRFPEPIFSDKWNEFLQNHGVLDRNPRWAEEMTSTVRLWAESFFEGLFTAGHIANQRAEGANNTLKKHVNATMTIATFFQQYFIFLDNLRQESMRHECINSQSFPANLEQEPFRSIRKQVANLYTLAVYEKIDQIINESETYSCHIMNLVPDATFTRMRVDKYDSDRGSGKSFTVLCDRRDFSLACTCRMFETNGLPCAHMFAAMKQRGITQIADANLNGRWRKDARKACNLSSSCTQSVSGSGNCRAIIRPYCERLAHIASLGDEQMCIAMREIELLTKRLAVLPMSDDCSDLNGLDQNIFLECRPVFGDPPVVRTKGAPSTRVATTSRCCSYCLQPGHSKSTCHQRMIDQGIDPHSIKPRKRR